MRYFKRVASDLAYRQDESFFFCPGPYSASFDCPAIKEGGHVSTVEAPPYEGGDGTPDVG